MRILMNRSIYSLRKEGKPGAGTKPILLTKSAKGIIGNCLLQRREQLKQHYSSTNNWCREDDELGE
jgi:hypothetical protein